LQLLIKPFVDIQLGRAVAQFCPQRHAEMPFTTACKIHIPVTLNLRLHRGCWPGLHLH
jgi:hypothetical protein